MDNDAGEEDVGPQQEAAPADASPEGLATEAQPQVPRPVALHASLRFTGTGPEYFRVWIVHTLLTILTLGIYSAWAKVRKARWFAQHTFLLGDSFDFHGRPLRILVGRGVALILFLAYSYSFDWSPSAGVAVLLLLLVLGPLLFGSAQRFRLVNTSWRGLRFGFDAPRARIYAVVIPLVLVWTGGTVWTAMQGGVAGAVVIALASIALWPGIHGALKTLQHRHARLGTLQFAFSRSIGAFYGLYARALGFGLLMVLMLLVVQLIVSSVLAASGVLDKANATTAGLYSGLAAGFLLYVTCWPYFAARMQQLVWERTSAGELRFHSSIRAGRLWKLVLGQMLLVAATLGLYWPFAAVAIARYRVESLSVEGQEAWPVVHAPAVAPASAVGDAALDYFDLDIGW